VKKSAIVIFILISVSVKAQTSVYHEDILLTAETICRIDGKKKRTDG